MICTERAMTLDGHETRLLIIVPKQNEKRLLVHSISVNFNHRAFVYRPPVYEPEKYAE